MPSHFVEVQVRKSTLSQREMKLQFIVLLMNGNDREALCQKVSRNRRETLVRRTRRRSDGFEVTTSR